MLDVTSEAIAFEEEIHFQIWTNMLFNLRKYVLHLGQSEHECVRYGLVERRPRINCVAPFERGGGWTPVWDELPIARRLTGEREGMICVGWIRKMINLPILRGWQNHTKSIFWMQIETINIENPFELIFIKILSF